MNILPAIIPVIVALAGGVAGSVATGYAFDKVFGDGNYTRKELAVDVVLGLAGVGLAKGGGKLAYGAYSYRQGRKARAAGKIDEAAPHFDTAITAGKQGGIEVASVAAIEIGVGGAYDLMCGPSGVQVTPSIAVKPTHPRRRADPTLQKRLKLAKEGKLSNKKRCNRTYRGKRCVRLWPHPGKHIYV